MSAHRLPRLGRFGPSGEKIPKGYVDSCEVLDCLFPIWWGSTFSEINGRSLSLVPRLAEAASAGQLCECLQVILDACRDGQLECVVPSDAQNPEPGKFLRIAPADWSGREAEDWEGDILAGVVHLPTGHSLSWANSKPMLFDLDQAMEWLGGLHSPHLLPDPPIADPGVLPSRSFAYLSETVSWLAYGDVPEIGTEDRPAGGVNLALFTRHMHEDDRVERYSGSENRPEPESEFGQWFAKYLASRRRFEQVRYILQDAVSRGDLIAQGKRLAQPPERDSMLMEIPAEVFQLSVHFIPIIDGIGLVPPYPSPDSDAFRNGADWASVRFKRHDLERLWGGVPPISKIVAPERIASPPDEVTTSQPRFSLAQAKDGYRQRVEEWPEGTRHPSRVDDEIWLKERFSVPRAEARTLRKTLAPPEWQTRGAPKSTD